MGHVGAEPGRMEELLDKIPKGVPVVMLNMLRYRKHAKRPAGTAAMSGREAYATYSKEAARHVAAVGGSVLWFGQARGSMIGPAGEAWDDIFLVRYPSIERFFEMVGQPAYREILAHRSAALSDSRLIVTVEGRE